MMLTSRARRHGFTLIETLIVVTLGTSMLITLGVLIYTFNKTGTYQQALTQSSASASALMREIESLAFPADAVLQTHLFSNATYTSSSTSLVLEIPSIDNSGNVIANTYDYAAFYVIGTNAYRMLEANVVSERISGTKQLSTAVGALTFSFNSADFTLVSTITVDIQTQAHIRQDTIFDHQREQIRLRNY